MTRNTKIAYVHAAFVITRAVDDILFTEHRKTARSQGIGSFQSSHGAKGVAGPTLTLQVLNGQEYIQWYEFKIASSMATHFGQVL